MMYVIVGREEYTWHVGEYNIKLTSSDLSRVSCVQADGDELDYILRNFKNIPVSTNVTVVRWFGDVAKFIAANLPWK
jgi:hypothetical protein